MNDNFEICTEDEPRVGGREATTVHQFTSSNDIISWKMSF